MIRSLETDFARMKRDGLILQSVQTGDVMEIVASGKDLYAVVPQTLVLIRPKDKVTNRSYFVATSNDQGASWTFVDGTNLNERNIKSVFPDFPATLRLPKKPEPVIDQL